MSYYVALWPRRLGPMSLREIGFSICLNHKINDLITKNFGGMILRGKDYILWNCAAHALLWLIWKETNSRLFEGKTTLVNSFCDSLRHTSSWDA